MNDIFLKQKKRKAKNERERGYPMNATEQKIIDAIEAKRQDIIDG